MTRFWVKTWVEPGGGRPNNTTNRRSLWRVQHIQIKAPRRFHIKYFRCNTSGGAGKQY